MYKIIIIAHIYVTFVVLLFCYIFKQDIIFQTAKFFKKINLVELHFTKFTLLLNNT